MQGHRAAGQAALARHHQSKAASCLRRYSSLHHYSARMTASGIAKVGISPICEIPAPALRIAAAFASTNTPNFDGVAIRPGVEEGEVLLLAASGSKAISVTCIGTCQRPLALPTGALRAVLRRDPDAEHVAVVEAADAGLSVRSFSASTTIATVMPEVVVSFQMPTPKPGACEVGFVRPMLSSILRDLAPLETVEIEPFATGLQVTGQGDRFSVHCLIAGWKAPEECTEAGVQPS